MIGSEWTRRDLSRLGAALLASTGGDLLLAIDADFRVYPIFCGAQLV